MGIKQKKMAIKILYVTVDFSTVNEIDRQNQRKIQSKSTNGVGVPRRGESV